MIPNVPLRLRGHLKISDRGPLLELDDGHIWRLTGAEDLAAHADRAVQIEAYQRGPSLLEVLWIGSAD